MRDDLSEPVRLKALLLVYGNMQTEGDDYEALLAPAVNFTIVRVMLAIASCRVDFLNK